MVPPVPTAKPLVALEKASPRKIAVVLVVWVVQVAPLLVDRQIKPLAPARKATPPTPT